jgi:diguanylate cyclase (GGDEF)-like protein
MPNRITPVGDGVYIELVRSLYTTLVPTLIMSVGYVASFGVMAFDINDKTLAFFALAGVLSGSLRITLLLRGATDATGHDLALERTRMLEKRFAIGYFQFAALLGLSGTYVFSLDAPHFHMLVTCLLVGYGAGVAAGVGLRPWIAIPSMLVAIVPSIATAMLRWDPIYWTLGIMMSALLIGGCQSLLGRYRVTSAGIASRLTSATLARHDVLTALPNRLALREWFESWVTIGNGQNLVAAHCLDLDGFKPVNDTYGHPAGDTLLKAVAMRLVQSLSAGDIAARLGGDEFVIIQRDFRGIEDAAALADKLRRVIGQPFSIAGRDIHISTCVGYAACQLGYADLDQLLASADEALYQAKGSGVGVKYNDVLMQSGKWITSV